MPALESEATLAAVKEPWFLEEKNRLLVTENQVWMSTWQLMQSRDTIRTSVPPGQALEICAHGDARRPPFLHLQNPPWSIHQSEYLASFARRP